MNLILDDNRDAEMCYARTGHERYHQMDWEIVRSYKEFVKFIETKGMPKIISFDHDLADEHIANGATFKFRHFDYNKIKEKTGYHAVNWLIQKCLDEDISLPECYCHSANPYGKMMIESAIKQYYKIR